MDVIWYMIVSALLLLAFWGLSEMVFMAYFRAREKHFDRLVDKWKGMKNGKGS